MRILKDGSEPTRRFKKKHNRVIGIFDSINHFILSWFSKPQKGVHNTLQGFFIPAVCIFLKQGQCKHSRTFSIKLSSSMRMAGGPFVCRREVDGTGDASQVNFWYKGRLVLEFRA